MQKFVSHIAGQAAKPKNPLLSVELRTEPGGSVIDTFTGWEEIGRATGSQRLYNGENWVQVTTYQAWVSSATGYQIASIDPNAIRYGWIKQELLQFSQPLYNVDIDGETVVKRLGQNNVTIANRVNLAHNIAVNLQAKGQDLTSYTNTIAALKNRLEKRQKKLQDSNMVKLQEATDSLWNRLGLGVAPIVAGLIVGGVVGIATTITLYFVFKPDYDESKVDLETSDLLLKALDNLAPEQRQEVLTDLENQVDKAYNTGKTQGFFSGAFKLGTPTLLLAAGSALILFNRKKIAAWLR